jgi:hypothetical protein
MEQGGHRFPGHCVSDDDASDKATAVGKVDRPTWFPTRSEGPENRCVLDIRIAPLQCEGYLVNVLAPRVAFGQGIELGPEGKGTSNLDLASYRNERSGSFSQSADVRTGSVGRSC